MKTEIDGVSQWNQNGHRKDKQSRCTEDQCQSSLGNFRGGILHHCRKGILNECPPVVIGSMEVAENQYSD